MVRRGAVRDWFRGSLVGLLCCATALAQGKRGFPEPSPSQGSEREIQVRTESRLSFPYGMQGFEELRTGQGLGGIEGWGCTAGAGGRFTVRAADDLMGAITPRGSSQRWLRVRDVAADGADEGFVTDLIGQPIAHDYTWTWSQAIEVLPAAGPVHPALMIQHAGPRGFEDAVGIEFAPDGAYLAVRGLGGDPVHALLFTYTRATGIGRWFDVELTVRFDRRTVRARVNGGAPVVLPLHTRPGVDLSTLRLSHRGGGVGNAITYVLDDVAVRFGAAVCEELVQLDFDTQDDLVTPLVNGQDLSTPPEFGEVFAISSTGANAGPAIFDSTPGGPNDPSQDPDLLVGLGNLVILQNNQASAQAVAGIFDHPNDDQDGGTVVFTFVRALEPLSVDLVDIDQGAVQRASVELVDENGNTRFYDVPAGWTGDRQVNGPPGFKTLDLTTLLPQAGLVSVATAIEDPGFDASSVVRLSVHFGSSGGLDDLALRMPCVALDFETQDDGVTPLVNGQDISTPPEFGVEVSISSSGANAGAAIFDSTPGGPNDPSQDLDLLVGLGNLLVLQNNNAAASLVQTVPGIFDRPNDDADGGTLLFTFPAPVSPARIDLVDIDPGIANASSVVLTDVGGRTRTFTVPPGWTEDLVADGGPAFRNLDLRNPLPQPGFSANATMVQQAGFDEDAVETIAVILGSSGAVDNLCICP